MKLLLLIAILIGCTVPADKSVDYDNARRAAIDAWEEVIGRVSDECYQRSSDATVMETGRFPESCMPPLELGQYIGCYMPTDELGIGGDMIYIYEGRTELQRMDTAVHEYSHLLHFCEYSQGKPIDVGLFMECAARLIGGEEPGDVCWMPGDYFHVDEQVWDDYGPDTVEAVGCAGLEL